MAHLLNPRQLKFVADFLAGKPAKQAYIAAGYAARGHAAEVNAERLLRKAEVKKAIDAARAAALQNAGATRQWVIDGLVKDATREGEGDELVSVR